LELAVDFDLVINYFGVNVLCTKIIMTDYLHEFSVWQSVGNSGLSITNLLTNPLGLATVQAVSHRLPAAATLVRVHVISCGICGGQNGIG
jgi:hypothetical protein